MTDLSQTRGFARAVLLLSLLAASAAGLAAERHPSTVPMTRADSGGLYISGTINGTIVSDFLVDTGSGFVVISERLFRQLKRTSTIERVRRVAANLADGRRRTVEIYAVTSLSIGPDCELGPVELAVIPGADRSIIGLNALAMAAPFTIDLEPPALTANCANIAAPLAAR